MQLAEMITHLQTFSAEERGALFERYCKWFLENDPRYAMQLKKVWLWKKWDKSWGRDKGIDLIAETWDGKIWAIQVKAYDPAYYVTKEDVDKFLSESSRKDIHFRLLIATTNNIGSNAQEVIAAQEKPVGLCLLDNLEASDLDWAFALKPHPTAVAKKEKRVPRPHQQRALQDIMHGFSQHSYGQLHMACGTGKTLVGLWLAEALDAHTVLVLVPSLSLVSQLYREWAGNCSDAFQFHPIFICSDDTVAAQDEEHEAFLERTTDLGFPVTTNADELLDELARTDRKKVIFSTYHSSPVIKEACLNQPFLEFDLVIADEAHRCAGKAQSAFATVVDHQAIRSKHKIFMTATPKIFSDHVKTKTRELEYEIISMDDEKKFGPVFHKLPFSQAIAQNLLSDYRVVISVMDNKTYQEYAERGRFVVLDGHETDARTLASQLLVAKAIKQYGLKKVITFHNRKKNAEQFVKNFSAAQVALHDNDKPGMGFTEVIFGEMSQATRNKILNKFKESSDGCALLGSVKCLSEGIDLPALDGIAFIDPRASEGDIIQAMGRVIRKPHDQKQKIGTIIIPIFIDGIVDEETALEDSCFQPVWKVVKALRAHDDVLAEELDNIRLELGKRSKNKPIKLSGKITINVPVRLGADFAAAIQVKLVERCSFVSLAESHPEVASQWHPTKNGDLAPQDVIAGSHQKAWWKCLVAGDHEWYAVIRSRSKNGNNCPMCRGSIVVTSNSVGAKDPDLARQWHAEKNLPLTPYDVHFGAKRKVFWQCEKSKDHVWDATIANRVRGSGCPYCIGFKVLQSNSLAATHHTLCREWDYSKNLNFTPYDVRAGSSRKAFWKCPKGTDHEWVAPICSRAVAGQGCPVCANKIAVVSNCLATLHPALAEQWDPVENKNTPFEVVPGSTKKAAWICPVDKKHRWKAAICDRVKKQSGCPHCYKLKNQKCNRVK